MVLVAIKATMIALVNTVKLSQPTVIGLLEGSSCNKTHGDSLGEYSKTVTIHGDMPLRGF
jgi:hypothetical protein